MDEEILLKLRHRTVDIRKDISPHILPCSSDLGENPSPLESLLNIGHQEALLFTEDLNTSLMLCCR